MNSTKIWWHRAAGTPRRRRSRFSAAAFALLTLAAATAFAGETLLSRYDFSRDSLTQWKLPEKLREISGLARSADGRLFAHQDESAIVYQIDYEAGKLVKAFALGKPTVRADFEGIAVDGTTFWLITSTGRLYQAREGADGERVSYHVFDTGLERRCEAEGLELDRKRGLLLILCKRPRLKELQPYLLIYAWSPDEQRLIDRAEVRIPIAPITEQINTDRLHPSGVAFDPDGDRLVVVAAHEKALVELLPDGTVVTAMRLPMSRRHRQAEGISFAADGRLLIADEGGQGRARLGVYRPRALPEAAQP